MRTRSHRERALTIAAVALVSFAAPSSSQAQTPPQPTGAARPPAEGIDYTRAFQQGLDEFDAGRFASAAQIWERLLGALGEERGYKVCYNLGLAYQKLGDATHAIERLESFAARAGKDTARDAALEERRQDAIDRVRTIKASHGALQVAPSPERQVVLVRIGASEPRPAGFVVYLAPGEHEVELYSGTARARRVRVALVAGSAKQLALDAVLEAPPRAPNPPMDTTASPARFPTGWLVAGLAVTAASCALPIAFAVDASNKRGDAEALGAGHSGYADAVNRFNDARTRYEVSWVLPGALALATAAIVIVQSMGGSSARTTARESLNWTRVAF
jgi:hypothetical protein